MVKKFRLLISALLVIAMLFSVAACVNSPPQTSPSPTLPTENVTIEKAGEYAVDVSVKTLSITVGDVTIKGGNLSKVVIEESVGEGEVFLKDMNSDLIVVKGGGKNSVHVQGNSNVEKIMLQKFGSPVRIVAEDNSNIAFLEVSAGSNDVIFEGKAKELLILADLVKIETKAVVLETVTIDAANVVVENLKGTTVATTEKATNAVVNDKTLKSGIVAKVYNSGVVIPPIDFPERPLPGKPKVSVWDGEIDATWFDETKTEFTIKKASQLAGLAELVNKQYKNFKDKTVSLAIDIDLNNIEWTPIGGWSGFSGTFDGNNHSISNLKMTKGNGGKTGLFSVVVDATIKNLSLKVDIADADGGDVGGLISNSSGSLTVDNCKVSGTITGRDAVAGILSRANAATTIKISNCENFANLTAKPNVKKTNGKLAGIVAINTNKDKNTTIEITNCKNSGKITNLGTDASGAAGIFSYLNSTGITVKFENCHNNGEIETSSMNAGGILGTAVGATSSVDGILFVNCSNNNTIKGTARVGGIIGSAQGNPVAVSKLENCVNNGEIIATGDQIGGLAGTLVGTILNCVNNGNVTSTIASSTNGNNGVVGLGGGVGMILASTNLKLTTIDDFVNNGVLSLPNAKDIGGVTPRKTGYLAGSTTSVTELKIKDITMPADAKTGAILVNIYRAAPYITPITFSGTVVINGELLMSITTIVEEDASLTVTGDLYAYDSQSTFTNNGTLKVDGKIKARANGSKFTMGQDATIVGEFDGDGQVKTPEKGKTYIWTLKSNSWVEQSNPVE